MSGPLIPDDVDAAWNEEYDRKHKPLILDHMRPSQQLAATADRLGEPAKKGATLADGYCARCDQTVMPIGVQYTHDHPEHYDGTSEWNCPRCGRREGRWTGKVLTGGASEPRHGQERNVTIVDEQARFPVGSQPR